MSSKFFNAGIVASSTLFVLAAISASGEKWLLSIFLFTVAVVVKQWPYVRLVMRGAVAIAVVVVVVFIFNASWPAGILIVLFVIGFIAAINKRPGKESLRIPRR